MHFNFIFSFFLIVFIVNPVFSQSAENSREPASQNITDEEAIKIFLSIRKSDHASLSQHGSDSINTYPSINKYYDQLKNEHYIRMEENAEQLKRIEELKALPQYSDPSYFGHEKKPKKRKRGKMKLCEECGIIH